MKRRRGNKKGRAKKLKVASANEVASNVNCLHTEENSGVDEFDNQEVDSGMDAETEKTPPPPVTKHPEIANAEPVGRPIDNNTFGKAVYKRVKVRIKTSKALESQHTSSDAPTQSDTDKSSQQVGSEKQRAPKEKKEDSANSLSETKGGASENSSRKPVGIKIKSRGLCSSSMSPCSNTEPVKGGITVRKDAELLLPESRYNKQELNAALEVIRKVMKMDASEPFNAPVNPVALGIPDYFDVIDTPMDFGTICNNLEKGIKYKNSEDVLKDVQHIWDNCYKYNNKGDYIVELMKRVKKNFTKYWATLGLFNDQPEENNDAESNPIKDPTPSSEGTTPVSGGALLSGKKFHGLKKHKEGCQCAICVMMRRRQEKEEIARMMGEQTDGSEDSFGEDVKPEGISHEESPFCGDESSNLENSPDADIDMERRGQEMKLGHIRNFYAQPNEGDITPSGKREGSQDLQLSQRSGDENGGQYQAARIGSVGSLSSEAQKDIPKQNEDGSTLIDHQKPKESLHRNQRAKMLENLRYLENPMLLELYGTLFDDRKHSLWNGPHSLVGRQGTTTRLKFHSAISSFIK